MKCPCRVGKHCAVQALPDICSCRSSTHSCTKTVHWLYEMQCGFFGPGYARPHILLQFSGMDTAPRSSCTTGKNQPTLMHSVFPVIFVGFELLFKCCCKCCSSKLIVFPVIFFVSSCYYSHSSSGMLLLFS